MIFTRGLALFVRFLLELALLAGAGIWAWQATSGGWRWVAVIALPLAIAVIWGLFLSPRATITIPGWARLGIEAALFFGIGAALASMGSWAIAALGVAVWAIDRVVLGITAGSDERAG